MQGQGHTVFILIQSSENDDDKQKKEKLTENRKSFVASYDMSGIQWSYSIPGFTRGWSYSIPVPSVASYDMSGIQWSYSIPGPLDMSGIQWSYSIPVPTRGEPSVALVRHVWDTVVLFYPGAHTAAKI